MVAAQNVYFLQIYLAKVVAMAPNRAKVDQHFSTIVTACKPHGSQHRKNTTWTFQVVGVL
jgi:Leu/Phe-tRNA-protein transferase